MNEKKVKVRIEAWGSAELLHVLSGAADEAKHMIFDLEDSGKKSAVGAIRDSNGRLAARIVVSREG